MPSRQPSDALADFPLHPAAAATASISLSAMAVMLRSLGVPARIATGFQSGIYNAHHRPLGDSRLRRARVGEAWIPGNAGHFRPDPSRPERHAAGCSPESTSTSMPPEPSGRMGWWPTTRAAKARWPTACSRARTSASAGSMGYGIPAACPHPRPHWAAPVWRRDSAASPCAWPHGCRDRG